MSFSAPLSFTNSLFPSLLLLVSFFFQTSFCPSMPALPFLHFLLVSFPASSCPSLPLSFTTYSLLLASSLALLLSFTNSLSPSLLPSVPPRQPPLLHYLLVSFPITSCPFLPSLFLLYLLISFPASCFHPCLLFSCTTCFILLPTSQTGKQLDTLFWI